MTIVISHGAETTGGSVAPTLAVALAVSTSASATTTAGDTVDVPSPGLVVPVVFQCLRVLPSLDHCPDAQNRPQVRCFANHASAQSTAVPQHLCREQLALCLFHVFVKNTAPFLLLARPPRDFVVHFLHAVVVDVELCDGRDGSVKNYRSVLFVLELLLVLQGHGLQLHSAESSLVKLAHLCKISAIDKKACKPVPATDAGTTSENT